MTDAASMTLDFMDVLAEHFAFPIDPSNRYHSIAMTLRHEKDRLLFTDDLREKALVYLRQMGVDDPAFFPKINSLPPQDLQQTKSATTLEELPDSAVFSLLSLLVKSVSYAQYSHYVLVKYASTIFTIGWTALSLSSRGKVLDLDTHQIVAYPFDKFFNLNESPTITTDIANDLLQQATSIDVTEKKDGTAIVITNTGEEVLIHTCGGWDSEYTAKSRQLLETKYRDFYEHIPTGYTFVFELIHPDNQIVVDYGTEEGLFLLAVRNLQTGILENHDRLVSLSNQFALPLPTIYPFSSLADFLLRRTETLDKVLEGWVFHITTPTQDVMFKLKYEQYVTFHKARSSIDEKTIYTALHDNTWDDFYSLLTPSQQEEANLILDAIQNNIRTIEDTIAQMVTKYEDVYGDAIPMGTVAQELKDHPYSGYVLRGLRGSEFSLLQNAIYGKYRQLVDALSNL